MVFGIAGSARDTNVLGHTCLACFEFIISLAARTIFCKPVRRESIQVVTEPSKHCVVLVSPHPHRLPANLANLFFFVDSETTNKAIEQIEMVVTLLALVKAMSCCFVFQIPALSTLICGPKYSGLGRVPKRS